MAKIFLSSADTEYAIGNSNTLVYGDSTNNKQKITLAADVSAITLDANVDGLQLSGNQADYTFQQAGNALKILKGDILVSTVDIQDDTDGSQFVFADKIIAAKPVFDLTKGGLYFDVGGTVVNANSIAVSSDTTAPKIISLTPADNSMNVLVGANFQITFDEPIKTGSGYIVINGADARVIDIKDSTQVSISGNTLTVNPTSDLKASSFYSLQVAKSAIIDLAGNQFAGISDDQTFNFKTDVGLALTGRAIDGYLKGSTVSITDRFGKVYTSTTDKDGKYSFSAGTPEGSLTVKGGTDVSTGKAFKGVMKAPEGAKVITPLTTLVQSFIEKGKSPEDAQKAVSKALGFDGANVDLTTLDPIQAVVSSKGTTNSSEKALFGQIMAGTAKMANFIVMGVETLKGAAKGEIDLDKLTDSLVGSLLDKMENTTDEKGEIDLGGAAFLQGVFSDSAKFSDDIEFDLDKMNNIADNFGSMMADFSDKMDAAFVPDADPLTFLADLGQIMAFAQHDAADQLAEFAASGGDFDNAMLDFMGDKATAFINDIKLGDDFLGAMGDFIGDFYEDNFDFAGLGLGDFILPEDGILPPLPPGIIDDILNQYFGDDNTGSSAGSGIDTNVLISAAGSTNITALTGNATFAILPGSYTHTLTGFGNGDVLNFFHDSILNVVPDSNDTDGQQSITATDPNSGLTATVTLAGLTSTQDAGLFNVPSFTSVFGAGTILQTFGATTPTTTGTTGSDLYIIAAGIPQIDIVGFGTGDILDFFADAILNVVPDSNDTDGAQTLTATDPVSGMTTTINLTGLGAAADASIFNIPSFLTTFPNSIV